MIVISVVHFLIACFVSEILKRQSCSMISFRGRLTRPGNFF